MEFLVAPTTLVGFALVMVRATAFVVLCPPFNTPSVTTRVKVGFAAGLALLLAKRTGEAVTDVSTAALVGALFSQLLAGLALAAFVFVLLQALQAAGELIDVQVGFGMAAILDPLSGNNAAPLGRLHQLIATAIIFAINGHVLVTRAFIESVTIVPLAHVDTAGLAEGLVKAVATLFLAAIEIALPIVTALFCTEVALGLLGKAAPQLNILVIGFGLKALVAFGLLATTFVLLPSSTDSLLLHALRSAGRVFQR